MTTKNNYNKLEREFIKLQKENTELQTRINLNKQNHKEIIEVLVKENKELKEKLENCVSPEVLRLNKIENDKAMRRINKASNKFDKNIKSIKRGLR